MSEHEIPVALTLREIRSLAAAANFTVSILGPCDGTDDTPIAAETAAMKLEVALMSAGAIER